MMRMIALKARFTPTVCFKDAYAGIRKFGMDVSLMAGRPPAMNMNRHERRGRAVSRAAPSRLLLLPPVRRGDRGIRVHASAEQYPARAAPLAQPAPRTSPCTNPGSTVRTGIGNAAGPGSDTSSRRGRAVPGAFFGSSSSAVGEQ